MAKLTPAVHRPTVRAVLALLLLPVLLGLSMLGQRPLVRLLRVPGPVRPLLPFAPEVPAAHRLAVRGAGLLFTALLVLGVLFLQARREQQLTARVEVVEGQAAHAAGLRTFDLITDIEGTPIEDFSGVRDALLSGAPVQRFGVERGGERLAFTVTLREGLLGVKTAGEPRQASISKTLGLTLERFFTAPARAVRSLTSRAWLAALTVTLAFAWWLALAVELLALLLGALLQRRG